MEKIRIFHSADAHGDMEAIKIYSDHIKEQKPDIAFLTGDLIHRVYTKEQLQKFFPLIREYEEKKEALIASIIEGINTIGLKEMKDIFSPELIYAIQEGLLEDKPQIVLLNEAQEGTSTRDLKDLLENPKILPLIGSKIEPYLNAREAYQEPFKIAKQSMEAQYREIAKIVEGTPCLILPGNHDGKCLEEIIVNRSLHKKDIIFKDIRIAGYGNAKGIPWWIPEELLEKFFEVEYLIEKDDEKMQYNGSKAGAFMIYKDPNIAVLHETPFTDEGLKFYIKTEKPYLVLAGHLHELIGSSDELSEGSPVIMPGKLGVIPSLEGGLIEAIVNGNFGLIKVPTDELALLRTFVEIEVQKEESEEGSTILQRVDLSYKQIKDGKVEAFN